MFKIFVSPSGGPSRKTIFGPMPAVNPGNDHGKRKKYICADPVFAVRLKNFYQKSRLQGFVFFAFGC